MKEFVNEYTFGEESFTVSGDNGEYSENTETRYSAISKVIETEKYIFIFQTPSCALVLEKSTVVGDISQIRYRLRSSACAENRRHINGKTRPISLSTVRTVFARGEKHKNHKEIIKKGSFRKSEAAVKK